MGLRHTLAHLFHPRSSNNHRARFLHPESILSICLLMVGIFTVVSAWHAVPGDAGQVLGFASNISVADVVFQTNVQRSSEGLAPLALNNELSAAAQAKGADMMAKQYWAHVSPDGTEPWFFIKNAGYSYTVAGENLARDFSDTTGMMSAWMNSPTHRANIMNGNFKDIGIAVVNGTLDGTETTLVVQMFGTPKAATAAAPALKPATTITLRDQAPAPAVTKPRATATPSVQPEPILETVPDPSVVPSALPTPVAIRQATSNQILGTTLLPQGNLTVPPLFSPLQILKAVFLALILLLLFTLTYDSFVIGHRQVVRLVGHNLSHVVLFIIIAYLLLSFKAGILG